MKPTITWIVAADGGRARIFEHRGPGKGLVPIPGLSFEDAHLRTQDINTDRPGRTNSSEGRGSAMDPQTDAAEQRELAFASLVAATLKAKFGEHAFERLIHCRRSDDLGQSPPGARSSARQQHRCRGAEGPDQSAARRSWPAFRQAARSLELDGFGSTHPTGTGHSAKAGIPAVGPGVKANGDACVRGV